MPPYSPVPGAVPVASRPQTLRHARLCQSVRFQEIRRQGRWFSQPLLAMGALANGQDVSRCGFSAGKQLGSAVVRNRARRRLREAVRRQWHLVAPGWDVVFVARAPLLDAPYPAIVDAVAALLRRARLIGQE